MKKISLLFLFVSNVLIAQNKQLLYGFSEIPQSLLLNPGAKVKNDWYFGIPLLSHVHFNGGTSGSTVYDFFANDGVDFNIKFRDAVNNMDANDFYSFNQQLELFSGGFTVGNPYEKNQYISFGMYQELDFILYFPKDYAVLAIEGNQNNINRTFNLGDFSANAELLSVFHVGYNKKVNDNFTFGVRGKIYSSAFNINSTSNEGRFITVPGTDNLYNHIFNLDLELRTSGLASLVNDDNSEFDNDIKEIRRRLLFGGDLGLGFDVGFTHNIDDQWSIDGSILDVGFVSHSKDVESYKIDGNYVFEGINPIFSEVDNGATADDFWSNIEEDFEDLFTVDTISTNYTTLRPIKLNASLNYAFGKETTEECHCVKSDGDYLNSVGVQLYAVNRPKQPQLALTAYYYRRLFNILSAKATYTIDSYSFTNLGFGLSANIANANFYIMADNLLQYRNVYDAQSLSLQLGFNYIFNKNED